MATEEQQATPRVVKRIRGEKLPSNTKYVGRPSKWGNTFKVGRDGTREDVINKYEMGLKLYLEGSILVGKKSGIEELKGFDLACWCHEWDGQGENPRYCHADILLVEVLKLDVPTLERFVI